MRTSYTLVLTQLLSYYKQDPVSVTLHDIYFGEFYQSTSIKQLDM